MTTGLNTGVGKTARMLIAQHPEKTNDQIRELVQQAHPQNKPTVATIAWYRADMKKNPEKKPVIEQPKRTLEAITNEILELEVRLEELREEHRNFKDEEELAEREMLAKLLAKYEAKNND